MKDGTVKMQGSPEEVLSQNTSFFSDWNKLYISSTGKDPSSDIPSTNNSAKYYTERSNYGILPTARSGFSNEQIGAPLRGTFMYVICYVIDGYSLNISWVNFT